MTGTYDRATHRYFIDGEEVPSVTRILKLAGLATADARWYTDDARERGTLVHAVTELVDAGRWTDAHAALGPDDIAAGRIDAYRKFLAEQDVEILASEQQVYCAQFKYAGTFDRVLRLRRTGAVYLVDFKPNPAPWHGTQLAGYGRILGIDKRAALYLRPNGRYKFQPYPPADAAFLRARLAVGDSWRAA